ncbi:hypothetical protein [Bradyrhizobium sp. CCBAU 11386]|uniref:hypothetical protein n=1 Tax=Bradyrhizobium sp. CCBAU 11386 TaxID=1630837 RepID=UPI002302C2AA|nr:hypothetical protein [Bradyrhizobium sp. CCBAU 11386]
MDVSAAGNHDFDFGKEFLERVSQDLSYPLLCANAEVSLPKASILSTSSGDIGFIGLTSSDLLASSNYRVDRRHALPVQRVEPNIPSMADELKRAGARAVVVLLHDGTDWRFSGDKYEARPQRLFAKIQGWEEVVDLVVGGDTLGRYYGSIGRMKFVQPWPFGTEIALVDFEFRRSEVCTRFAAVPVKGSEEWDGFGADFINEARQDVLGTLPHSLTAYSGGRAPLAEFMAECIFAATAADISIAYVACGQPASDGIFAYLGSGSVTRLQIAQLTPWTTHEICTSEVTQAESNKLCGLANAARSHRSRAWAMHTSGSSRDILSIATTSGAATHVIAETIGRELEWKRSGETSFEGVRTVLGRVDRSRILGR